MTILPDKYILNRCSQCGEIFTKENMIEYETVWVCAGCKPVFMQKIKEGIEIVPKLPNMIGWKIFFFVILAQSLYSFTLSIQSLIYPPRPFLSILDLIIGPLVIVALFGFALGKKIWNRVIWKILFPIAMLYDVIIMIKAFFRESFLEYRVMAIVAIFVLSPLFIFSISGSINMLF